MSSYFSSGSNADAPRAAENGAQKKAPAKKRDARGSRKLKKVSVAKRAVKPDSVFLNIPYDPQFERLYLAHIVGLTELGLTPRATLGIPGGTARLDRIFELITSCRYSIHDLSRVQLDRKAPRTPRFNMPFELGLAIAWSRLHPADHTWFVCETENRRAQKSLSDFKRYRPEYPQRARCRRYARTVQCFREDG